MKTQKYKKIASTLSTNNRSVRMRDALLNNPNLGALTVSITKADSSDCPDRIYIPDDIAKTKELLKVKSFFLEGDIKISGTELILPFKDSDIFNYNLYPNGSIKNYGGIELIVWFLPNVFVDDIRVVEKRSGDNCDDYDEIKITPEVVKRFPKSASRRDNTRPGIVDVRIQNIGNYTGTAYSLFVTVFQSYSDLAIGSFYV